MADIDKNNENRKLTIGDIADELGLSKTTISRAISGKGRISDETKRRVQEYIKEHDYRPNLIAKSLAESKTFNLGVVLPSDTNLAETPFFQSCLMGICEVAASHDYDVVVTTVTEDDIALLKRIIFNHKVDGVILTRSLAHDLPVQFLKENKIPFVVVGSTEDEDVVQIDSNHSAACAELTSILLVSGNENLALLAGNQEHIVNKNRMKGFIEGHKNISKKANDNLIFTGMNNKALIDRAIDRIMMYQVDCIVCTDDLICSRVLARLNELNYSVPADIKVASFYNSTFLENHNPPVTAININVKELGVAAGERLIKLIAGEEEKQKELINYEIVLKKSTK
ncbi:LacI family DNA-binding transcriptional regulator [Anaeromicropila herbilytica]|uniref:Catabolite control protein A n=1 Tax=Anaeromicropila herbilytica TaxID=2785025 RepID=A0A7R7ICF8_9FIRM|nr:LacI family DNA-binding transcriptional regulator [Anaeromicropila herbilytica]BCN30562.1 catabolite control protein A [Anaeromicropila herbilytica]